MYISPEAMRELQDDVLRPMVKAQLDAMYKRTEDKIASLNERSAIEAQWVESRAKKLMEAHERSAQMLNRMMTSKDMQAARRSEYVEAQKELLQARMERAEAEADIAAYLLAEKQQNKIKDFLDEIKIAREGDVERNVQFVSRVRGGIGERLGEKVGRSERRIVELEKSLRELEARGERQVEAKYKELSDRLFERSKELDSFTAEIETRRAKCELIAKEWQESVGRKEQQIFNDARDELETLVRSYLLDRSSFAVLRPDAKTRAIALQGTLPGTPEGEAIRMLMQFKSYPISFIQKILGREVYGQEGAERVSGLFQVMAITTIFGYMAMAAKDLAKGKEPRELLDPETGLNWKTVGAAMQQGGGLGIYGDFLFGEMRNRAGQGFLATVAGPTFGEVDRLADIWGRLKAGDDAGAASFNLLLSNTPFGNHFMLRPAADYLFLRSITEAINPGALRRMEEKTTKEKEQEWMIRPSETYLDPLGAVR
jgi:hypothetical protein